MIGRRKPRKTKTGKAGITRLSKKDMDKTRTQLYFASEGNCQMREVLLKELTAKHVAGEISLAHFDLARAGIMQNCWRWVSLAHGHDAHIRTKRNNGDDLSNRIWSCPPCHVQADHNAFGKPCPPKVRNG